MKEMFCNQCEQAIAGTGCIRAGTCGKDADVSALQDLLVYELKGIGFYGDRVLNSKGKIDTGIHVFIMDALFATLTNVNFDAERFYEFVRKADEIKRKLSGMMDTILKSVPDDASYKLPASNDDILEDAYRIGKKPG